MGENQLLLSSDFTSGESAVWLNHNNNNSGGKPHDNSHPRLVPPLIFCESFLTSRQDVTIRHHHFAMAKSLSHGDLLNARVHPGVTHTLGGAPKSLSMCRLPGGGHMSPPSTKSPETPVVLAVPKERNPILQVSNEYMRVTGLSHPLQKFLTGKSVDQPASGGAKPNGALLSEKEMLVEVDEADAESGLGPGERRAKLSKQNTVETESPPQHPQLRLRARKQLHEVRNKICHYSVVFAMAGIFLTLVEAELCSHNVINKEHWGSQGLKTVILITTLAVMVCIFLYHRVEIRLTAIDTGADDWRVVITGYRILQFFLEQFICLFCPLPGTGYISWPSTVSSRVDSMITGTPIPIYAKVPVDVILTVPMFLRCYLIGRLIVLHSHQFQDSSTRTIAALNRVSVDFKFVLKTMIQHKPIMVLLLFAFSFWISISWVFFQCERSTLKELRQDKQYFSALWFIVITFLTIGYGDVVPSTYCGRVLAVLTGVVGVGVSSALIAVISRNLDLSKAEKHVNAFMRDSKLIKKKRNAAAAILQHMWFIYKYKYLHRCSKKKENIRIRLHQRKFLAAINEFRRVKWEQRKLAEQNTMLIDVAQVQTEMTQSLLDITMSHRALTKQMASLTEAVFELKTLMSRCDGRHSDQMATAPSTFSKKIQMAPASSK